MSYYTAVVGDNIFESGSYLHAKKHALSQSELLRTCVKLYKTNIPIQFYELWGLPITPIETFYDRETFKIVLIQRLWKKIFIKRKIAMLIIRRHFIRAILNPYTILFKNKILREFNDFN